jgi:hypothetical protein
MLKNDHIELLQQRYINNYIEKRVQKGSIIVKLQEYEYLFAFEDL